MMESGSATVVATTVPPSFAASLPIVGSSWVISSAVLTTYSTTRFLKYKATPDHEGKINNAFISSSSLVSGNEPADETKHKKNISIFSVVDRPTTLTLFRFSGSLFLGLIVNPDICNLRKRFQQTLSAAPHFALPALFLFVANYCNSIALDRIGISLTYTSKCGIPLVTVLLTLMMHGIDAMPSVPALLSLVPIAVGIGAASWHSPTFEIFGFLAALISTAAQAALVIASKQAMVRTSLTGLDAQRAMAAVAIAIALAVSIWNGALHIYREHESDKEGRTSFEGSPPVWLALFAVTSYHIEYCLSFMFVRLVTPITYGTCDAIRRLAIIIAGKKMFGGPKFSFLNLIGISLALMGALLYSLSK